MLYYMSEVFWENVFAARRPGMSYYLFQLVSVHFSDPMPYSKSTFNTKIWNVVVVALASMLAP